MANTSAPRGFSPVRDQAGRPYNGAFRLYDIPASDSTAVGVGDFVIVNGTSSASGRPQCIKATAAGGAYITGAVVGFLPDTRDSLVYRAASTLRTAMVADDPDLLFECQEDAVGGALALASVSLNADWVDGTVSTVTGLSAAQLDTSTVNTTNTLQLRIVGFSDKPDNEPAVANAKVLVRINLHTYRNLTGT